MGKTETINAINAATTILGPAGVSHVNDPSRPIQTLPAPIIDAVSAIFSGVVAKRLADAAGIISNAVMSKTPTTFIEIAITAAIKTMKKKLALCGFKPSATAIS